MLRTTANFSRSSSLFLHPMYFYLSLCLVQLQQSSLNGSRKKALNSCSKTENLHRRSKRLLGTLDPRILYRSIPHHHHHQKTAGQSKMGGGLTRLIKNCPPLWTPPSFLQGPPPRFLFPRTQNTAQLPPHLFEPRFRTANYAHAGEYCKDERRKMEKKGICTDVGNLPTQDINCQARKKQGEEEEYFGIMHEWVEGGGTRCTAASSSPVSWICEEEKNSGEK